MTTRRSQLRTPSKQHANHSKAFLTLIAFLAFVGMVQAAQLPICPTTIENDPPASVDACGVLLTVGPNLSVSTIATGTLAYNGSDSTFGIINNSNHVISSLLLMGGNITNFTANGIRTYISANGVPIPPVPSPLNSHYETYYGPLTTFTQIDFSRQSLLINFVDGLAPDAATYWSLAGDPAADVNGLTGPNGNVSVSAAAVPEPSTSSLAAIAVALAAIVFYRRKRNTLSAARRLAPMLILPLATLVFGTAAIAADIVKLPSSPTEEEISTAKADFANGSVIAMIDADPAVFSTMFNVGLPKPRKTLPDSPLRYYVIAAHKLVNGSIHTYVSSIVKPGENRLKEALSSLNRWADRETATPIGDAPLPKAWTEVTSTTADATYESNDLQVSITIYRANSSNTIYDWYMITQQTNSTPSFGGCTFGGTCGWYNRTSDFSFAVAALDGTPLSGSALTEHGPIQNNGSTTYSYSLGASVSGFSAGVSGSFSQSWSQSDVTTTDNTNILEGTTWWHDDFSTDFDTNPPDAVKGLFTSYQGAVYRVPAGTPGLDFQVTDKSEFYFNSYFTNKSYTVESDLSIPVSPPSLSIFPQSLRLFPGQQGTFFISSDIPNGNGQQLAWTVGNSSNVTLNIKTGTGDQLVTVDVPSTAKPGLIDTLNIDTNPVYASPDTRTRPYLLPITVVSSSDVPPGVLFTGGLSWTGNPQPSAEIWNPATGKSSQIANMLSARYLHTATPIQSDQILIAGGLDQNFNLVGPTEIYSEATQSFSPGPQLQVPRAWHTATFLNDGTVLLAGGQDGNGNAIAAAEIYDPVANQTTAVGNMTTARMKHSATLLRDGTVFIYGGTTSVTNTGSLYTSEIYNPQTKTFSQVGSLSYGYQSQAAALLNTDQLLLVTGYADAPGNMMLCTGGGSACSQSQTPADVVGGSALVPLPNNSGTLALLAGGNHSFLFDSTNSTFDGEASMLEQRSYPNAVLIQNTNTPYDGSVLVAGGVTLNTGSSNGKTLEANNPQNNVWQAAGLLDTARSQGTMTLVGAIPITSSVQLSSSLNPSISGNQVTFTATVTGAGTTATGTVKFYDGTTVLGTSRLNNGSAQLQTSSLSVGSHNIIAVYSGGVGVSAGTSNPVTQVVNPIPVTPVFTKLSSQTITYGTLNINLSGQLSAPGPIYPGSGETVQVSFGGTSAPIPVAANGVFNINRYGTGGFSVGNYPITYSYAGDVKLKPAQDNSTSLTVTPATPVFSGLTSSQTITAGTSSVHLSGQLNYQQTLIPLGSVSVAIGGIQQSAAINNSESCAGCFSLDFNTSSIPASTTPYPITYSYAAAGNYTAASDRSTSLTVNAPAPTTTAVTSSLNPSTFGASVTFTGTVTSQNGTPTGSVFFYDGQTQLGSATLSGGTAKFATTSLAIGSHMITAAYDGGNTNYARSTSAVLTQVVKGTPSFSGLTASQTIGYYTPTVTLSGSISAGSAAVPAAGEQVPITIGTATKNATIGSGGSFSLSFPTQTLQAGSYHIVYSYGGDASLSSATDSSTTLTVGKITPVFSNLTPSQTINAGTASITLTGKLSQSGAIPSGSVSTAIGGQSASNKILADGTFSISFPTSSLTASATPYTITYSYTGDANFNGQGDASTTLTISAQSTATALTSSLNPSTFGASVTFTSTVTSQNGTPTGSVFFYDGQTQLGSATLSGGTAKFSTTSLAVGTHAITAVYDGGNTNFARSTSAVLTQTVNKLATVLSGLSPSQTIGYQTPNLVLKGTISAPNSVYPPTTETVQVTIGSAKGTAGIGQNGAFSVTFPTASLAVGSYPVTYSYAGDTTFAPASDSSTTLTIGKTTPVFSNLTPSQTIKAGTSTIQLSGKLTQGVAIATGSVSISINGQSTPATIGSDGTFSAPVNTSAIPASSTPYRITYSYAGNTDFNPASDSSTTLTVTSTASATILTSSLNPSSFGQPVTFDASVTASTGTPTGTVTFKDGATTFGTGTLSGGKTSFGTGALAAGTHSITAIYAGDSNFASSTSAALTQTVRQTAPSFTGLTASQSAPVKTASVQLSGVISAAGPVYPAGEFVNITIGSAQGKATINPNGTFSTGVNITSLAAGSYPIQYSYAGDTNFASAADSSTTLTITGEPAQTTLVVAANPNPAVEGQTVTLTATVVQNGPVPTGNVTFSEPLGPNSVLIYGNADLVNGVATVVVTSASKQTFSVGTHTLFATYSGDANYKAATSSPYIFTVTATTAQAKNK